MLWFSPIFVLFLTFPVYQCANNPESAIFHECCKKAELADSTAEKFCKYPPAPIKTVSARDKAEMMVHFNEFVECYSGGNDNSDCCKSKNTGKLALCQVNIWRLFNDFFKDFCNGAPGHRHYEVKLEYAICERVRLQNSRCNRMSVKKKLEGR